MDLPTGERYRFIGNAGNAFVLDPLANAVIGFTFPLAAKMRIEPPVDELAEIAVGESLPFPALRASSWTDSRPHILSMDWVCF